MRLSKDRQKAVRFIIIVLLVLSFPVLTGCGSSGSSESEGTDQVTKISEDSQSATLKLSLTDAPHQQLSAVFVNIKHIEVLLEGQGKKGRLVVAEGLGLVDLLTLQNGITMPLGEVQIPEGVKAHQLRLVLEDQGHFAIKQGDEMCNLATPSGKQSGVKIKLSSAIEFQAGNTYSLLIDFDAHKSVVVKGNGGCLLKPVLKLKEATVQEPVAEEEDPIVVKLPAEGDENHQDENEGWDPETEEEEIIGLYDWELEEFF